MLAPTLSTVHLVVVLSSVVLSSAAFSAPDHAMHLPLARLALARLAAEVRCEEVAMYCSDCHRPVYYSNPDNQGWCETCKRVIEISPCSVSYWYVAAAMVLPLFAIS